MKKANIKSRSLQYMAAFGCIGGVCEDNCCIGWDVDIDLKTYHKYQKVSDPELKTLYKQKIKPYPYFFSEEVDYARVKLGQHKRCPFLNSQGLCMTQAKLGEDYLSNVCATYPRMTNDIDGVLENTLTLSCPVAARLVLLNPDGLSWVDDPAPPKRRIVNLKINTTAPEYKKHPVRHFHSLRAVSVQLLSDRRYPIWERLYHLGQLFEVLGEAQAAKRTSDMPGILAEFAKRKDPEDWDTRPFCTAQEASAAQLHRVDDLIDRLKVYSEIDSPRFVAFTRRYHKAFGWDAKRKKSQPALYQTLHDSRYVHFEAAYGYILENYLINFVYKNLFPFTESEQLFEAYTMLALRFVMIRSYLIALCADDAKAANGQPLHPETAVEFIQVFAKAVEHHKSFSEDTLSVLRTAQLNHMAYMETLLFEQV